MVRVGSLTDRAKTAPGSHDSKTDMTPEQQLEAIMKEVRRSVRQKRQDICAGHVRAQRVRHTAHKLQQPF